MNDAAPAAACCANCGTPLSASYCGACGQRREPPLHSLWHFAQLAAEDLTHADSRLWQTLAALLFRPGYLTAQFLAGRRASYLPPVRLYLVLSVAFFLWAAALPQQAPLPLDASAGRAAMAAELTPEERALLAPRAGESPQQRAERLCRDVTYRGPWQQRLAPAVPRLCRRVVLDQGRELRAAFLHNLPRAMFVFLPLLAGAMKLLYWRPAHYYVEHLLLFVHNHACVFLLLLSAWAATLLLPMATAGVRLAVCLYIPWYLFRSMRVVYGQNRWLTLGKLTLVTSFYVVSGALMLLLNLAFSALTL